MDFQVRLVQGEVSDLREEVQQLRGAFNRLRRLVESDKGLANRGSRGSTDSYSFVGQEEFAPGDTTTLNFDSGDRQQPVAPAISGSPSFAVRVNQPPPVLSWAERERICRGIGEFIQRALAGVHRGPSGRDLIPLASRVWLVARSYTGEDYQPVRVFHRFADCKALVKRGQDCGASVFIGLPSEKEGKWVAAASGLGWPETFG